MRWDELFADLEGQLEAAAAAELAGEVADRTRRELSRLRLVDRLRAAVGADLTMTLLDGRRIRGVVALVGPDWLLLGGELPDVLVPLGAVTTVAGLSTRAVDPDQIGVVEQRTGLAFALRRLARDRVPVQVTTVGGAMVTGRVDRVGADFFEVSERALGDAPRQDIARVVPFSGLLFVRPG